MVGSKLSILVAAVMIAAALIPAASAGCATCGKGDIAKEQSTWESEAANFAAGLPVADNSNAPTVYTAKVARESNPSLKSFGFENATDNANSNSAKNDPQQSSQSTPRVQASQRSESFAQALAPLSDASGSGIVLDISPNSTEYIAGAININYEDFLGEDKQLKPLSEIARILGDAGISEDDPVKIYGECQPCGGGPSAATYVYWMMKYLGHKNVKLLDGGIDDWVAARLPTQDEPVVLPKKSYTPSIRPELLSTYDYVKSGSVQIIDARTAEEYDAGSIIGSINIPYDKVLDGKEIKDEAALKKLFAGLAKDRPVVVYTNTGVKASMVWFSLDLLGYDARLYTWQDWITHQPKLNLSLDSVKAEPNPAKTGDIIKITAILGKEDTTVSAASSGMIPKNETILTVKGCSDCGFGGFSLGAANSLYGNKSGVVQLGSATNTPAGKTASYSSAIKSTATIRSSEGAEVGKVNMHSVSDREFTGIWNANVAGGTYQVTIVMSTPGVTETFRNAVEIEVTGSTSKYKNLGN